MGHRHIKSFNHGVSKGLVAVVRDEVNDII